MALQVGKGGLVCGEGSRARTGVSPVTWLLPSTAALSSDPGQRPLFPAPIREGALPTGPAGMGLLTPGPPAFLLVCLQFEAFCAEGLAPGWSLLVQGQVDSGEDK